MQLRPTMPDPAGTPVAPPRPGSGRPPEPLARELHLAHLVATWLAASAHHISPADLCLTRRGRADIVAARQFAIHLVHVVFGFDCAATARVFKRDRRTVARACAHIENLRDHPEADRRLDDLEHNALALAETLGLEVRT